MAVILIIFFVLFLIISASVWESSGVLFAFVMIVILGFWVYSANTYEVEKTVTTEEIPIYSITTDKNFQLGYSEDRYKFYIKDNEGAYRVSTAPIESPLYMSDDVEPHISITTTTNGELPWYHRIAMFGFERSIDTIEYKIYVPSNTIKLDFNSGG